MAREPWRYFKTEFSHARTCQPASHPGRHSRTCMRYDQGWGWKEEMGGGGGGGELGDERDVEGWGETRREARVSEIWIGTCTMQSMMVQSMMVHTSAVSFFLPRLALLSLPLPLISLLPPLSPHPLSPLQLWTHSWILPRTLERERAVQCLLNWMVSATSSI